MVMDEVYKRNCRFIDDKYKNLTELSDFLCFDFARRYKRTRHASPSPHEIAELYKNLRSVHSEVFVSRDFAVFCRAFSDVFEDSFSPMTEPEKDSGIPRIAYLQNTFSDRAYRCFSSRFERVSASYYPGFSEVCEEVYNGNCSHGILPIQNSRDGQLISFRRLILKYDLKISLVTDIETTDDSSMRFALLQKNIDSIMTAERCYLDLFLVLESTDYAPFLSACRELGASVVLLNSLPLEYSDDRYGLSLQLDVSNSHRNALLCFLEASHIRYEIVGMYDIIKQ